MNNLNELTTATNWGRFTVAGMATEPKGGYNSLGDPVGVTNVIQQQRKGTLSMIRVVVVGGFTGGCIGAVGYGGESILSGRASAWTYVMVACGVLGLIAVWWYLRRLRKQESPKSEPASLPSSSLTFSRRPSVCRSERGMA